MIRGWRSRTVVRVRARAVVGRQWGRSVVRSMCGSVMREGRRTIGRRRVWRKGVGDGCGRMMHVGMGSGRVIGREVDRRWVGNG
jgi:hypothetical protein